MCMYQSVKGYIDAGLATSLFALHTTKHAVQLPIDDQYFHKLTDFSTTQVDNRVTSVGAFRQLFSHRSYILSRFVSDKIRAALDQKIAELKPDIIQFETLSMAFYIKELQKKYPDITMVYRMHNVEQNIWHTLVTQSTGLRRAYLSQNTRKLATEENDILSTTGRVLCISAEDAQWLDDYHPTVLKRVYPFAIDAVDLQSVESKQIRFYHLGSMDWQPNIDAMQWWLRDIWPRFSRPLESPFYMAGRHLSADDFDTSGLQGVHIVGEVSSVDDFLQDKSVLVVPLRSGSGMRIKILEAMQRGIVVISTRLGLTGIEGEDGVHYLVADTAEDFILQMDKICDQPSLRSTLAAAAQELVRTRYDLSTEIQQNLKFFR